MAEYTQLPGVAVGRRTRMGAYDDHCHTVTRVTVRFKFACFSLLLTHLVRGAFHGSILVQSTLPKAVWSGVDEGVWMSWLSWFVVAPPSNDTQSFPVCVRRRIVSYVATKEALRYCLYLLVVSTCIIFWLSRSCSGMGVGSIPLDACLLAYSRNQMCLNSVRC